MKRSLLWLSAALVLLFATQASAQVLFTGKTSGEGNGSVYVFSTTASADGVSSFNNWSCLDLGLTGRFDIVLGYGDMSTLGEHFPYAALGGVVGLPTQKFGFDSIVFQIFSAPHANRNDSSPFFGNSVVIISRDMTIGKYTLTPYTGYNGNYAFGDKNRLMTFSKPVHQLPVGVFLPLTKSWGLTTEYDYGKMVSFGVALNYSFRYR